jgi:hypothetical protein
MSNHRTSSASALEHACLAIAALGLAMLLSFPTARGVSETLGWLPFWLLALPLSAWAVARGLRYLDAAGGRDARPQATVHRLQARRVPLVREERKHRLRRAA